MEKLTGERFLPSTDDARINYEHLHRFFFVREYTNEKMVLDVGCGEGIGSYIFSKKAKFVVGIDIDKECIKSANEKYKKDNLIFLPGSIHQIPFKAETFDLVVCFEVIEHIEEQEKAIYEMKRVLKKSGMFIISTPNKKIYSDERNYKNPYHIKEFYKQELVELLKTYFKNIHLFGQKIVIGSEIFSFSHTNSLSQRYKIKKDESGFSEDGDYEPMYFLAIATDNLVSVLASSSHLIDTSESLLKEREKEIDFLSKEIIKRDDHIKNLDEELNKKWNYIKNLQREMEEREGLIKNLQRVVEEKEKIIQYARRKFQEKNIALDAGSYQGVMDVIKYAKSEINPFSEFELLIRPIDIEKYRNNPSFSKIHIIPHGNANRLKLLLQLRKSAFKKTFVVIDSAPARNKFKVFGSLLGASEIYIWNGKTPIYKTGKILPLFTSFSTVPIATIAVLPLLIKKFFQFASLPFKFLYLLIYYLIKFKK